ncbi:MAG: hypothetical protein DRP89_08005 [Candidatus Neomarinimicrobiota bacterium]|nr:MAG: hypothetical protein DRP89_08005 [Candidatus Neomarinimicrobiota bacterium]
MKNRIKSIAFMGIFIALVLGVGYALALLPNVELITAMIFLSGVLMGVKRGIFVGTIGEFLFSALNPIGSGLLFPPMLIAQVISMGFIGAVGGILRQYIINWKPKPIKVIVIGAVGFVLTLIYDIFVSLAYPISAGFNLKETIGVVIAGIAFSVIHLVVNTAIFITLVPVTAQMIIKAVPYFSDIGKSEIEKPLMDVKYR